MLNGWKVEGDCEITLNRLAREEMKIRILRDIRIDLTVCELAGFDRREYLNELKELIDGLINGEKK